MEGKVILAAIGDAGKAGARFINAAGIHLRNQLMAKKAGISGGLYGLSAGADERKALKEREPDIGEIHKITSFRQDSTILDEGDTRGERKAMEGRLIYYLCDPEKNTECEKSCCVYNPNAIARACYSTTKRECARLDFDGQPVENPDMNEGNREKVKKNFEEQGPIEIPAEYLDAETVGNPGGGYKDPKWQGIAQEITKEIEEKGLPWFAGLFNQKLIDEIERKNERTEGGTDR